MVLRLKKERKLKWIQMKKQESDRNTINGNQKIIIKGEQQARREKVCYLSRGQRSERSRSESQKMEEEQRKRVKSRRTREKEERKGQMEIPALGGKQENSSETGEKIKGMDNHLDRMEFTQDSQQMASSFSEAGSKRGQRQVQKPNRSAEVWNSSEVNS